MAPSTVLITGVSRFVGGSWLPGSQPIPASTGCGLPVGGDGDSAGREVHRCGVRASPRDPAVFTERDEPKELPTSGYAKDAVEIEGYIRGFARRRAPVPEPAVAAVGRLLRNAQLLDYSPEQTRFLNFGRVLDTARLRTEFGFDPDLTENVLLPLLRPLYRRWVRVETIGCATCPPRAAHWWSPTIPGRCCWMR